MSKIEIDDRTGSVTGITSVDDDKVLEGLQVVTIRKLARQWEDAPRGFSGPFPPEMSGKPALVYPDLPAESLAAALDSTRMFFCRGCQEILDGTELAEHKCSDYSWSSADMRE